MIKYNISLLKTFSLFTLSNLLNAAIPFLLLPILTNYLSPTDFGIVSIFFLLTNIFTPFIGFNGDGALSRYYFEKETIDYPKFVSQVIFLLLACFIVLVLISLVFGTQILNLSFGEIGLSINPIWILIIVAIVFFQNFSQLQLSIWQVQGKAIQYGFLRIGKTITEVLLSVFLVVSFRKGWSGRINAQLIASFIFALVTLFILYKERFIVLSYNKEYLKKILWFGLPLVPHVLSGVVISFADRWFIANYISFEEAGLYSVGYQVGMVISLFQNSFNQAWSPWLFKKLTTPNETIKKNIVRFTYLYFSGMILIVLLLTAISPLIFKLFVGKQFSKGIIYVFWIAAGFGLNGMYKMVVNYIFFIKKTYWITLSTIITATINILLCWEFVPKYGAIGAAKATCLAFGIEFILIWLISARLYKMPWFFFLHKTWEV